ncbi:hypothetical protein Dimus_029741 [Dionaea muscipula]
MKLSINSVNPKKLFRSKKQSRSSSSDVDPRSFSTSFTSDDSTNNSSRGGKHNLHSSTPTSVLPPPLTLYNRSGEWSSSTGSGDMCLDDLKEAFRMIDRNGDGKITKSELMELFFWIGSTKEAKASTTEDEIVEMMNEIDVDGDGCISFDEFTAISSVFAPPASDSDEELRETFEVFDADHDGKISAEELLKVFSAIGDDRCSLADCRRMIRNVDVNGDGFVCFEDFKLMMQPHS